jgi:beta-mannosidase
MVSRHLLRSVMLVGIAILLILISDPVQAAAVDEALQRIEIAQGWRIKSIDPRTELDDAILIDAGQGGQNWLDVGAMPATVHDILLRHGKIEAPWLPHGTEKCFWVGTQDWIYAVRFVVRDRQSEARLRFQGIENKVDVYLNGKPLATHNSKLPLVVDLNGRLAEENVLVLHCFANALPDQGKRRERGTYLGPNPPISSVGVFDKIFLEISQGHRLEEVVVDTALDEGLIWGRVSVDVTGISSLDVVDLRLGLLDPDGKPVSRTSTRVSVTDGTFRASDVLPLDRPSLWWPRGYGKQPLYRVEATLMAQGRVQEVVHRTIGFRYIKQSEPLHFMVNGVPVFLRGGNWVTPNLMSDVWDRTKVDRLFDLAENAHFNAFRVWGPAPTAPPNAFYEQADARGFLLWQDFPRLPMRADSQSIATCQSKARATIKRLKHHPSILCWCGINEAAQWAHEDYNKDFTDHGPWGGLAAAAAVGEACKELDPARYYQPSSPYFGMNPNDPREGNTHGYTNMWFVPGYDYLNFASEDTRISAPPLHSLRRFMDPQDLWPEDYSTLYLHGNRRPFPETWMSYTCAESWKKTGPVEQFYDATDAAGLVYRLGMAESLYYQDIVERQRRGRPATEQSNRRCCGGYLVWKYNDSWPQVYSSKVDYFLEPKHIYYALRRAFRPLMLSFDVDTYLYLWVINDTREPVTGTLRIRLYHLEAREFRKEIFQEVTVAPGQSQVAVRLDKAGIRAFRKEHILFAELTSPSGQVLTRTNAFADIERRLTFPEAKLDVQVKDNALVITTDHFARCVNLTGDAQGDPFGWFFEDNYFDLLPGETKIVRILGDHAAGQITARPWYSPHATIVLNHKSRLR